MDVFSKKSRQLFVALKINQYICDVILMQKPPEGGLWWEYIYMMKAFTKTLCS